MSDDLITSLRALAAAQHSDLSVAADAADKIELLTRERDEARAEVERVREAIRTIRARCVELDDSDAVSATFDISNAVLDSTP